MDASPDWAGIFDEVPETKLDIPLSTELPDALVGGTLFRNGAAPAPEWSHLFDGDGLIRAFHFSSPGHLVYRSRYVETLRRQKIAAGRKPKTYGFGSLEKRLLPAHPIKMLESNNTSNTNVIRIGAELVTLIESGAPYAMDPTTLETLGQRTYEGKLGAMHPLSAHPHRCSTTGEIYNFSTVRGPKPAIQTIRHTAARGIEILDTIDLPFSPIIHDFALTENYLVFCLGNLRVPPRSAIKIPLGYATVDDVLDWESECASLVILAPRDGSTALKFEGPPYTVFHIAGAVERGNQVAIHMHRLFKPGDFAAQTRRFRTSNFHEKMSTLHELTVNTVSGKITLEEMSDISAEFPYVDGRYTTRGYDHIYATVTPKGRHGLPCAIGSFSLSRYEWEICDFGDGHVVTEPVFAADPGDSGDGAGWLMTIVFHPTTNTSELAVIDARNISDGPMASAQLGVNSGYSFHGFFDAGA